MDYDVVIVGAGPAGLSAAIRLRQMSQDLSVCVLEKGSDVGAHILSGNVFETRALDELIPDWRERDAPIKISATDDKFFLLTSKSYFRLPTPPQMRNQRNYVISLSQLTRWLASQAEGLGVEIYPGFAASELLVDPERDRVHGVATNDVGVAKDGSRKDTFQPGMELHARCTLLAEGARGSLTRQVVDKYSLRAEAGAEPQTYALGLKEVWRVAKHNHKPGTCWHSIGYPLDNNTYGGSFLYHMSDERVAIGLVVALDYENPYLSPYGEFQRFKLHPLIRPVLDGGEVLQYGARTLNEGGLQSLPKLYFPGGALIGCCAGFLNVPKIKGTHTAMKSGMLAAETAYDALSSRGGDFNGDHVDMSPYEEKFRTSWIYDELYKVRNIRPAFQRGLIPGLLNAAFETYITRGRSPWTLTHGKPDHNKLHEAQLYSPIKYPSPDGQITFDVLTSLSLSGTNHSHDERCHLLVSDRAQMTALNYYKYAAPESRYCPAKVYEYHDGEDGNIKLQINAQNCLHCKACDIKDPGQNILWTVPEGGGGPKYTMT